MPDMFCYMSGCKSRVANVSVKATRDVYFREHGGSWLVFANQHVPIHLNGKIDRIKLTDVPMSVQNAFQNLAVNCGPLSETISVGIPCNLTTCNISNCAVSEAEGRLVKGMK